MNKEDKVKALVEALATAVNNFSPDDTAKLIADELCHRTHRTLQQNTMRVFVAILNQWAQDFREGNYDARNEATVKLAASIVKQFKDDFYFPMI